MAKLTDKQKAFVDEYMIDLNATQAAIRAGYSAKSADKIGPELLGKTRVAEAISEKMTERSKRTEITQDRVLQELAAIGFCNASDFVTIEKGVVQIKDTVDIDPNKLKAIAGVKEGANGIEIKLLDKLKALELLGKHLGLFKDKLEVSGSIELEKSKLDDLVWQMRGGC